MLKLTLSSVFFRDFVPRSATDLGGEGRGGEGRGGEGGARAARLSIFLQFLLITSWAISA